MKTRSAILALMWTLLSIGTIAQTVALTLPDFTLPPGATSMSSGGWNWDPGIAKDGRVFRPATATPSAADLQAIYSVGAERRLITAGTVSGTVSHYAQELAALGWKPTLTDVRPGFGFVRYSIDSADGPLMGSLLVMPFPELTNQFVAMRLARSHFAWPTTGGRTGGGGAGAPARDSMGLHDFTDSEVRFPGFVELAPSIKRFDMRDGGGSVDYCHQEVRFQTFDSPAAIMKDFEPQFAKSGWTADVRGGDAVQAFTLFRPPAGGDSVALVVLTTIPGGNGLDFMLWVIRNRR